VAASRQPLEIAKPDTVYYVNWGGHTDHYRDEQGNDRMRWVPHRVVKGTAYDTRFKAMA